MMGNNCIVLTVVTEISSSPSGTRALKANYSFERNLGYLGV